jgi:hypothetical protein
MAEADYDTEPNCFSSRRRQHVARQRSHSDDLKRHLEREFGPACRDRYWAILEQLFNELGYRDYLGALQRYRVEHPKDIHLLSMSSFLVDYPFANRLYPGSLDVIERFRSWGRTVILSDGDVVFQPRKVERSGIFEAVEGNVLIYIHKEEALDDVERRYPAEHYVPGGRQAAHPDHRQEGLELACDHSISAAGPVCHDRNLIAHARLQT